MERKLKMLIVPLLAISVSWMVWAQSKPASQPSSTPSSTPASLPGAPKLLELGTTTCTFCRQMKLSLEDLRKQTAGRLNIEIVDLDKNPEMDKKYPLETVPVQVFLDPSGKELYRHVTAWANADIIKKWKELGYDVAVQPPEPAKNVLKVGGG